MSVKNDKTCKILRMVILCELRDLIPNTRQAAFIQVNEGVVSKETVVLRRWGK